MTAAIIEHDVTVFLGDVREQLGTLDAGSVQCTVTSPPYYGLRDYGVDGQIGLEPSPAEYVAEMVGVFREARRVLADDGVLWLNLGDSYSGSWGNQGRKDERGTQRPINGPMMTPVHDGRYPDAGSNTGAIKPGAPPAKNLMGMPWRVAFGLQDDGWTLRNAVIWNKPNAMPESVTDRLSCRYEHVFLFSKSRRYWFNLDAVRESHEAKSVYQQAVAERRPHAQGKGYKAGESKGARADGLRDLHPLGRNPGDVWTIATSPFPGAHFATMPAALAERCILAGCPTDGTVLDPFAGSGTTLMTARKLGRKSVGIELNPDYIDIIRQRIGQTPFDFGDVSA